MRDGVEVVNAGKGQMTAISISLDKFRRRLQAMPVVDNRKSADILDASKQTPEEMVHLILISTKSASVP